jgi:hypothetical protein
MVDKYMKKLLNLFGHKGKANQDDIEILPHSSQNGCHQQHKQMLVSMWGKGKLVTVGGNVKLVQLL